MYEEERIQQTMRVCLCPKQLRINICFHDVASFAGHDMYRVLSTTALPHLISLHCVCAHFCSATAGQAGLGALAAAVA